MVCAHPDPWGHPTRQEIGAIVAQDPGISLRALKRRLNRASGTVCYHVQVLKRSQLLVEHRVSSKCCFFPANFSRDAVHTVLLQEAALRELLATTRSLSAKGPVSQSAVLDACARLGWSRSTTQHRLGRLCQAGLVSVRAQGRYRVYQAAGVA